MAIKARIWYDEPSQGYCLSLVYNKGFIDALKQLIPSGDRDHDENTHIWYFKEMYGDFVRDLAQKAFGMGSVSFTSRSNCRAEISLMSG